jgi:hypothetical protein
MVKTVRAIAETVDTVADVAPTAIYNYVGRWQSSAASLTTAEIDTAVFPEIPHLVSKLRKEVKDLIESLSLSRLFLPIPRAYQDFREVVDIQSRSFAPEADKAIKDRQLPDPEKDRPTAHGAPSTLLRQTPVITLHSRNSIWAHPIRVGAGLSACLRYKKKGATLSDDPHHI